VRRKKTHSVKGGPYLEPDEEVLLLERPSRMIRLPKYVLTLGIYGLWRNRDIAAVTDRRLIFGRGIVRRHERSIPLGRVQDVTFLRRGLSSYANVVVTGRRGTEAVRIGPTSARRARTITAGIGRHLL
jgi:PH (Pleckstrin Homology) domain-containing protein